MESDLWSVVVDVADELLSESELSESESLELEPLVDDDELVSRFAFFLFAVSGLVLWRLFGSDLSELLRELLGLILSLPRLF